MHRSLDTSQEWKALFEAMPEALLVADDQGRYVFANAAAVELTGYPRDELLTLSVWSLTPDPDVTRGRALWATFTAAAGRQSGEYRLRRKDGTEISVAYSAASHAAPGLHLSVLRRAGGPREERTEVLGSIRDALGSDTEAGSQGALLLQVTLLQDLTAALAAASMPADVVRAVYEHGRELLQIRAVSLYLADGDELVLRGSHGLRQETIDRYGRLRIDSASPVSDAFRGGSALWIPSVRIFDKLYSHLIDARSAASGAWVILPLRSGGAAIGVLGLIFPDAHSWNTQQKAMIESAGAIVAQALERSRLLEAEQLARELQQRLMAIVGHDLRSPLQAIVAGAGFLKQKPGPEQIERTAGRILNSARRMTEMIDDLFDFARAATGQGLKTVRVAADAHQVVARVIAELQAVHPAHPIRLRISGPGSGTFDPRRLEQLVSNLVSNAAHYSPAGSLIELISAGSEVAWELSVHNSGPPIDPAVIPTLFKPFSRGPGAELVSSGLGLGLFIAQGIVRAHDGTIEASSSAEAGTTFRVRLPR